MSKSYILTIDQGTSSTKVLIFDEKGVVVKKATAELKTNYLSNGFVEQDPIDILKSVREACESCLNEFPSEKLSCIGISNQRETFVLWDKKGNPIYNAIVWACKRSTDICDTIFDQETWLKEKTGLLIDPYFSGTKLLWILKHKPEIANRIVNGEIYFGTVDTWLLYKLTKGKSYFTDYSNASRTLFFNLHDLTWDKEILDKWGLGALNLPVVKSSSDNFGITDMFGLLKTELPITSMIGDSHAAMFGEACFQKGKAKMTLGTGCSLLMHVGNQPVKSKEGLLSTIGWSTKSEVAYAWEGAIVACGSMVEWLMSLNIISEAKETEAMAFSIEEPSEVYLVPAFSGLGAPFWQMNRKASFHGMTFGTTNAHLVKATLESICFQIKAVIDAMQNDLNERIEQIAMHGGLSKNGYVQLCLSELMDAKIRIQDNIDVSAQGAAFLAGLEMGIFGSLEEIEMLLKSQGQGIENENKSKILESSYAYWLKLVNNAS